MTTELNQDTAELSRLIDQLQRVRSDLQEGEAFSQAIFNAAQNGLIVINTSLLQIMDANQAAAEILGYEVDDLIGEMVFKVVPQDCQEGQLLATSQTGIRNQEGEVIHRDGHRVPVIRSLTEVNQGEAPMAVLSFLNITARKQAESKLRDSCAQLEQANEQLKKHKDQMVQSEKLASIGQLAAGVAHEINNPVGFVTSNLGTILEYCDTMSSLLKLYGQRDALGPDRETDRQDLVQKIDRIMEEEDLEFILEDIDHVLTESMEGVKRVADIVQNLKSFAREDSLERRPHDINEGIEAMIKMVWNELKYRCTVERNLGQVPVVQCHAGQVNQVIMNVLVNASHAMPEGGGTITVGTAVVGGELEISIADNGKGIPPEILPRIFDPFFTTKDVGKGTGLGLSISHGIIQDHGGRIEVDSEVGVGTTFRIYLPLAGKGDEELIG